MTRCVIFALLAGNPPMEIRLFIDLPMVYIGQIIVQIIANVALCNPFSVFSNNCDTLNANVAFSPNAISNVKYNYKYSISIV